MVLFYSLVCRYYVFWCARLSGSIRKFRIAVLSRMLREVGLSNSRFTNRLVIQKTAYLLQEVFGVDLGAKFFWYSYGPYSYEVARDYKLIIEGSYLEYVSIDNEGVKGFLEFVKKVGDRFVTEEKGLEYWLEIIASLHMLSERVYPPPEDVIEELVKRKPYLDKDDVRRTLEFMRREKIL